MNDWELLMAYQDEGSEEAFSVIVQRYINLVYSAAFRQTRDTLLSQEISQAVFLVLARKADRLTAQTVLPGWLLQTTRFVAANVLRAEKKRSHVEKEFMEDNRDPATEASWHELAPLLDEAMSRLSTDDHNALVLRFFDNKSFKQLAMILETSDDNAQKRVSRAVEKLRVFFGKRGQMVQAATLMSFLSGNAVEAAPSELAEQVAAGCVNGTPVFSQFIESDFISPRTFAVKSVICITAVVVGLLSFSILPRSNSSPSRELQSSSSPGRMAQVHSPAAIPLAAPQLTNEMFSFSVHDETTGNPVGSVRVTLHEVKDFPNRTTNVFYTDRAGHTFLPLPRPGVPNWNYRLELYRDGYVPKYVSWSANQNDNFSDFPKSYATKLTTGTIIGGKVVGRSNEPITGAEIIFSVNGPAPGASKARERLTMMGNYHIEESDGQGRWHCDHMPEKFGMLGWRVLHPQYQELIFECDAPERPGFTVGRVIPLRDFLAENAIFQLTPGMILKGLVVDENGVPIPNVRVTQNHEFTQEKANGFTDGSGSILFRNLKPNPLRLTIKAPGRGPTNLIVNITGETNQLRVELPAGRTMLGKVVDESGSPVSDATIAPGRNERNMPRFRGRATTDKNGRFSWPEAPFAETFAVSASGFTSQEGVLLQVNGEEQVITLKKSGPKSTSQPRFQVIGHVIDEANGEPIKAFDVYVSETRRESSTDGRTSITTYGRTLQKTSGIGRFEFRLSSSVYRFVTDIEANGYLPATVTNQIAGQDILIEVALKRGEKLRGIVVTPGGNPAAGAVLIISSGSQTPFMRTAGELRVSGRETPTTRADAAGRFTLDRSPAERAILATHENGFAELRIGDLEPGQKITLQPWGRIEGRFFQEGKPAAVVTMQLGSMNWRFGERGINLHLQSRTDAGGNFVFEKIPPGEHKVHYLPGFRENQSGIIPLSHGKPVIVEAGKTARITLGGEGKQVIGRVISQSDSNIDWLQDAHKLVLKVNREEPYVTPVRSGFASEEEYGQAKANFVEKQRSFWNSEAGKEIQRGTREYILLFSADGSFKVADVPAGNYELLIAPTQPGPGTGNSRFLNRKPLGTIRMEVVISSETDQEKIDLGSIPFSPIQ